MFAGYGEPKSYCTLTPPYWCSMFTGRIPISGLGAIPLMDQRSHLPISRNSQSGSASVCSRQAGLCLLQEAQKHLDGQKRTSSFKVKHVYFLSFFLFIFFKQHGVYLLYMHQQINLIIATGQCFLFNALQNKIKNNVNISYVISFSEW